MRNSKLIVITRRLLTPDKIPGINIAAWFSTMESGSVILDGTTASQWSDISGNNRHATQATKANQPTYTPDGLNRKPVLTFNGTSTFLNAADVILTGQNWTFFAVASMQSQAQPYSRLASAVRSVASGGNGTDYADPQSWVVLNRMQLNNSILSLVASYQVSDSIPIDLNIPYIIRVTRNTRANSIALNGQTPLSNAAALQDLNTTSGLRIGRSINPSYEAGEHWAGVVSELMFIQNLPTVNHQPLEGYFAWQWGLQANLVNNHPFKFSPPYI